MLSPILFLVGGIFPHVSLLLDFPPYGEIKKIGNSVVLIFFTIAETAGFTQTLYSLWKSHQFRKKSFSCLLPQKNKLQQIFHNFDFGRLAPRHLAR
jgi:hypothetical protein